MSTLACSAALQWQKKLKQLYLAVLYLMYSNASLFFLSALVLLTLRLSPPASVCFVVCLLSLAWALVLYARACSLIRPGHLHMTPAAILCRLLWRVSIFLKLQTTNMYDMNPQYNSQSEMNSVLIL